MLRLIFGVLITVISLSCGSAQEESSPYAHVTKVEVQGKAGAYTFYVTLESPDTGCEQYADWWEVIDTDGRLIYRRILLHSHANEQPFTRSGGNVNIKPDQKVYVRMHMNNSGYSSGTMLGTVESGFEAKILDENFAQELQNEDPLPSGCRF